MPTTYTEPRSDAYTGLLAISLGAMVLGSIILWMDFGQYPSKPAMPSAPKIRASEQGQQGGVAGAEAQPLVPQPAPPEAAPAKEKEKE